LPAKLIDHKALGRYRENFFLYLRSEVGSILEDLDSVDIARGVGVTIVRADHEAIRAALLHDVGQIIRVFAGDVHPVFAGDIFMPFPA